MSWLEPSDLLREVAENLRNEVAPEVEDPFIQSQIYSTYSILLNLSNRVEPRQDWVREVNEHLRGTLEQIPDDSLPERLDSRRSDLLERSYGDELERNRALNAFYEDLIDYCWSEQPRTEATERLHASLRESMRYQLDRELALTK